MTTRPTDRREKAPPRSVSAALVRAFVMGAAWFGVPPEETLAAAGLTWEDIADPDGRIPRRVSIRLWHEAPRLTGDPLFGLHAAQRWGTVAIDLGLLDIIDYVTRSCSTLGEALERVCRYGAILQSELLTVQMKTTRAEAEIRVGFVGLPPGDLPQAAEFVVAMLVCRARSLVEGECNPRGVTFQHAAPPSLQGYRDLFRCPVRFDAPHNAISLHRDLLAAPLVTSDPRLLALLDRQAVEILERLPPGPDVTDAVRRAICDLLGSPEIRVESVGRRLGMTARTLQRRIRDEGRSFQEVLDEVRRDVAQRELRAGRFTVEQIALLLGYSEPSSFQRAFRRWTGTSPRAFRRTGG